MVNGGEAGFWKPVALSLMTALVTLAITTWTLWPRDVATRSDIMTISNEVSSGRIELQQLAIQVAGLNERVRLLQEQRSLEQ
jgi:cell division protein FtsL